MSNTKTNTKAGSASKNPFEALKEFGTSTADQAFKDVRKIGSGIFDQFTGGSMYDSDVSQTERNWREKAKTVEPKKKREFSLFNYQQYYEKDLIKKEIRQITEVIRQEIAAIKKADSALINEVKDIEKLSLESLPDAPGLYHVRFMEIVLTILRNLRAKIGESRTWLQAMVSKRKKRGSLFAALTKKKGTQYSMSQEISASRSIQ